MPIVRHNAGTLALGSAGAAGAAVECVLVMSRFAPKTEMTHIATQHGLSNDLGIAVARYHKSAPTRKLGPAVMICEILEELDGVFDTRSKDFGADGQAIAAQARVLSFVPVVELVVLLGCVVLQRFRKIIREH